MPKEKRPNATKLTLYVDDMVIIRAKQKAIAEKTSLSLIVEKLLRQSLEAKDCTPPGEKQ